MHIILNGKRWELRYVPNLGENHGDSDGPHIPDKVIRIQQGLSDKKHLEIALHEMLHACCWYLDEEVIEPVAHDIAHVLTKLGWKKENEGA